ncbi:acyltransferase [Mesorhizobium sp. CA8]|uniref:acyltransferase family protein n=1 Tax=unclassified Mesorhizobium TaxID=325217 RepID=UPI00112CD59E|nr:MULTISPECIES: acyltransferase [unclassified Mesorhizobium]MBZ9761315.1 acyltransferase [Mesorhizobium sp. CA8]TPI76917.1 acyltransferase [Mesorhizobium sp. B2-8-9]
MNIQHKLIDAATASRRLYIAPLDGLRFVAFLAVFFHHMSQFKAVAVLDTLHNYGWVGVELFFLISSFLFFHLLDAEYLKTGTISIRRFFVRRLLRIYPLMILFPIAMLAYYGSADGLGYYRLAGLALFLDNAISWFGSYNKSIPNIAHLWTLSFEFQVYLFIPFVFLAYRKFGKKVFLGAMAAVLIYSFAARAVFQALNPPQFVVWETPFLRPESILMGMALYIVGPRWHWGYSFAGAAVAGYGFLSLQPPWMSATASAFSYPLAAIMFGGLVDAGLRAPVLAALLSSAPMRFLGRISYGLYVYHYLCIVSAPGRMIHQMGWTTIKPEENATDYWAMWATALLMTIALATISYYGFEKWIAQYKRRFEAVEGRSA